MAMPGGWAWIRESRAHDSACQALGQGSAPKGTWAAAARGTRVHLLLPVLLHLKSRALPAPSFSAATNRVGFQNEHHSKVLLGPRRGLALLGSHLPVSVSTPAGPLGRSSSPNCGARWLPAPQADTLTRNALSEVPCRVRPSFSCFPQRLSRASA